jgi:hypothetical protein
MESTRATAAQIALNRVQNAIDFKINLEDQPKIFKHKLFTKTLDDLKDNPEDPKSFRTVTIKCLQRGCK